MTRESWLERIEYANGAAQRLEYDKAGRVTRETDPLGAQTRYTYDKAGRLTAVRDALGNTTRYAYTPEGWLQSATQPDGTKIQYSYDLTGQLLSQAAEGLILLFDKNRTSSDHLCPSRCLVHSA